MGAISVFTPLPDRRIAVVHETPEAINRFRLSALKQRLILEEKGMKVSKGAERAQTRQDRIRRQDAGRGNQKDF